MEDKGLKKSTFKLVGLSRVGSNIVAQIEPVNKEEAFPAFISGTEEQKEKMWAYCENDWKNKKLAWVEYRGEYHSPYNATVLQIKHA